MSQRNTRSLFDILIHTKTPSSRFDHLVDRMSDEEIAALYDLSPEAQMCLLGELPSRTATNDELVGIVDYAVDFLQEAILQHEVDEVVEALNAEASVYLNSLGSDTLPSSQKFRRRMLRRLRKSKSPPSEVVRVLKF